MSIYMRHTYDIYGHIWTYMSTYMTLTAYMTFYMRQYMTHICHIWTCMDHICNIYESYRPVPYGIEQFFAAFEFLIATGVRMEGAFFPVRVLKKCGIIAVGKCDLAHDNRLVKAGSYAQRRLTHHLVIFCFSVRSFLPVATGHSF